MPAKITIVLVSLVVHGHGPVPVYGANGRPYDHARFDEKLGRHALRIPYEEWKNGVGEAIVKFGTSPQTRWLPLVELEEDAEKGKSEGAPAAVGTDEESKAEAPSHLDDVNAGFLRSVQSGDFAHLEETKIEEKDGQTFQVKRELVPAVRQPGNNSIPEGTTIIPVNAFVSVAETRTPIDKPAEGESTFVEDAKKAIGGVESQLAPEGDPVQKTPEGENAATLAPFLPPQVPGQPAVDPVATDAITGTAEAKTGDVVPDAPKTEEEALAQVASGERVKNPDDVRVQLTSDIAAVSEGDQDSAKQAAVETGEALPDKKDAENDLAQYKSNFRKLWSIAKTEGVTDFEKITKAEDLIAAIELHREAKTAQ